MKKQVLPALLLALLTVFRPVTALAAEISDSVQETDQAVSSIAIEAGELGPSAYGLDAADALTPADFLELDGEALLLFSLDSETMVYAKNIDERRAPASLTKVMTCLVALENGNLTDQILVTEEALSGLDPDGSSAELLPGETYTLTQLLYCLMVKSANDAALVIAQHIGGTVDGFVEMMNTRAQELGCTDTHFVNPHGLHDENHYTTARDLAKIMVEALKYDSFSAFYSTPAYEIPGSDLQPSRTVYSTNYLISQDITSDYYDSRVIGGKTGFTTPAGRCVVCVAEEDGQSYLAVVLGATGVNEEGTYVYESFTTASSLFDLAFSGYATEEVMPEWVVVATVPVSGGKNDATLITASPIQALLPLDYDPDLLAAGYVLTEETYTAPLAEDTVCGNVTVYYNGIGVGQVPLVVAAEVKEMAPEKQQALGLPSPEPEELSVVETPAPTPTPSVEPTPTPTPLNLQNSEHFETYRIIFLSVLGLLSLAAIITIIILIRSLVRLRKERRRYR